MLEPMRTSRRFAEVGDAVVRVLRECGCELHMIEIHAAVEDLRGEPVSQSSVKNYLARGCRRSSPVVERVSQGGYRLIS
jgi:hypothetical protein